MLFGERIPFEQVLRREGALAVRPARLVTQILGPVASVAWVHRSMRERIAALNPKSSVDDLSPDLRLPRGGGGAEAPR
jgi:hypothetical protein